MSKKSILKKLILLCFITTMALSIIGCTSIDNTPEKTSNDVVSENTAIEQKEVEKEINPQTKESIIEEVIKVTSAEMLEDYSKNIVRAEKNYNDKLVEVTGEIGNIGKDYITLVSGKDFALISVQCFMKGKNKEAIAYVDSGQIITVQGTVSGKIANISIKDCKIID